MRATFIRHGQSTGNAGLPCDDLSLLQLTDLGHQQANILASNWIEPPRLIVTSPYLRTQQTAQPTLARFPHVPVEVWPIQEFTYLQPSRWNGTSSAERMPALEQYWNRADPAYCDGDGAESFAALLTRVLATLDRLASLAQLSLTAANAPTLVSAPLASVLLFSHGQFMQALRSVVVEPSLSDHHRMMHFWKKGRAPQIANASLIRLRWQPTSGWSLE